MTLAGSTSNAGTPYYALTNANTYGTTTPATLLTNQNAAQMIVELGGAQGNTTSFTNGSVVANFTAATTNVLPGNTLLTFGGTPAGQSGTYNGPVTLQLDGISQTVAGLNTGGTGAYSIVGNNATVSTLTVNNAAASAFNGVIGGTGTNNNNVALTKAGAGTLTLSGANTYTGATAINAGNLNLNSAGALGASSGATVANGAELSFTATSSGGQANPMLYNNVPINVTGTGPMGGAALFFNAPANATSYTIPSAITLGGTGLVRIESFNAGNNYINLTGAISGTGGLELLSGGAAANHLHLFTLSGALSYAGATQFDSNAASGRVLLSGTTLPTATVVSMGAGNITGTNTVQFDLGGNNQTVAGLQTVNVTGVGINEVVNSSTAAATLTVNNTTAYTYSGILGSGTTAAGGTLVGSANNLGLTKIGSAAFTLTGANTFTGATTVSAGTLAASAASGAALGSTSSISVNGGGTLLLGTANQVNTAATITMGTTAPTSGILSVAAGANQGTAATLTSGGFVQNGSTTQGLGALTLNSTATLAYGGGATTLVFGAFTPNGHVLAITGFSNTGATGGNSGGASDDRLVFAGDQTGNFGDFNFGAGPGVGVSEVALDGGFFEVVGAVPEPSTWVGGLLGLGLIGLAQRRRATAWLGLARRS